MRLAGGLGGLSAVLLATAAVLIVAGFSRLPWPVHEPSSDASQRSVAPSELRGLPLAVIEPRSGPPEPAGSSETMAAPPAIELEPSTLAAVEQLATELADYRAALDERQRLLAAREAVVAAVEARVSEQVGRLEAAGSELERAAGAVAAEERARITQLVKVYEAMKAKSAAAIFDPMPLDLLMPIIRGMRETKVAAIVAAMDPAKARALTAVLAHSGDNTPAP